MKISISAKSLGTLYHYMSDLQLIEVLESNKMPRGRFKVPLVNSFNSGGKPTFELIYGVSLTRLFMNRRMFHWYGNSIIAFDGTKLSNKYKIRSHDDARIKNPDHYSKHTKHQAEEFVITDRGIDNVKDYITAIYIPQQDLSVYMKSGVFDRRTLLSKFNVISMK